MGNRQVDSQLPISKTSRKASSALTKAISKDYSATTLGTSPQSRKHSSPSHRSQLRSPTHVNRPETRPLDSAATPSKTTDIKVFSNQPSDDNDPTKNPKMSIKRRPVSQKALTNQKSEDAPTLPRPTSRNTSRHPARSADPNPTSNLRHPSGPLLLSRKTNVEPASKSLPFQTPLRKTSNKKPLHTMGSQNGGISGNQVPPSPGTLPPKPIHKSRLPVATPTTTTHKQVSRAPRIRNSVSAADLSSRPSRGLSKIPTTSSETLSVHAPPESTTNAPVSSRRSSLNAELHAHQGDVEPCSSSRPAGRSTRVRRPPNSTDDPSVMDSATSKTISTLEEESNEVAESNSATQAVGIILSPVVEEVPRRPITRAMSKHLLQVDNPLPPEPLKNPPLVRRRRSRVMEIAQSFEDSASGASGTAFPKPAVIHNGLPHSNLGFTPNRNVSATFSSSSTISPNSPNLTALAATLTKQHVQRDRQSRTFVSDMLRYSTMSSLNSLRWEDGAGDGLLTDQNETEAMVADISMVDSTPVRPETEKAALALATARSNFLTVAKEDEGLKMNGFRPNLAHPNHDQNPMSSPSIKSYARGRISSIFSITSSPLAHDHHLDKIPSGHNELSQSTSTKVNNLVAQEVKLALVSAELESYQNRELELQRQLQQSQTLNQALSADQVDPEREVLLVAEMNRLEDEIHDMTEINIDLENQLDRVKFENEDLRSREELLKTEMMSLKNDLGRSNKSDQITSQSQSGILDDLMGQITKAEGSERGFRRETQNEIEIIKSQLMMLSVIKLSLSLQESLAQQLDNEL